MRIALIYNEPLPSPYPELDPDLEIAGTVAAIQDTLAVQGHAVRLVGLRKPLSRAIAVLSQTDADLVFNLFEGFDDRPVTEWMVARTLETLPFPFTGASSEILALCLNKAKAKEALIARRIPTPSFQLLRSSRLGHLSLDFPVIVKPLHEDGSRGLSSRSVVYDRPALEQQVRSVEAEFGGPALVEHYLPGREFAVSILAGQPCRVLPVSQVVYSPEVSGPPILTYKAKWLSRDPSYHAVRAVCPARVPPAILREVTALALAAYEAVGSPPYARVDLRADGDGLLHVLEVNPNPDLSPDAGMARQAQAAGLDYGELIAIILEIALKERRFGPRYAASYAT